MLNPYWVRGINAAGEHITFWRASAREAFELAQVLYLHTGYAGVRYGIGAVTYGGYGVDPSAVAIRSLVFADVYVSAQ